jgi:hypothetical protein
MFTGHHSPVLGASAARKKCWRVRWIPSIPGSLESIEERLLAQGCEKTLRNAALISPYEIREVAKQFRVAVKSHEAALFLLRGTFTGLEQLQRHLK